MSEIIHKTEPVEHWIVDRKAYRLATNKDVGKTVLVADLEIPKRMSFPEIEQTLEGIRDSQYRFEAGGTVWCYAYVQDDSLLQPKMQHVVDCVTVDERIAQKIRDDAAMKQASQPQPKPIDWTKPVRTKDGRAVRVLCTDGPGDYSVAGYIEGETNPRSWTLDGYFHINERHSTLDLENIPQSIQREYWVNVYPEVAIASLHYTRIGADSSAFPNRLACVKVTIDCEEGEGL